MVFYLQRLFQWVLYTRYNPNDYSMFLYLSCLYILATLKICSIKNKKMSLESWNGLSSERHMKHQIFCLEFQYTFLHPLRALGSEILNLVVICGEFNDIIFLFLANENHKKYFFAWSWEKGDVGWWHALFSGINFKILFKNLFPQPFSKLSQAHTSLPGVVYLWLMATVKCIWPS